MDDALKLKIEGMINGSKVFLFMKGDPNFPQCGFSAQAVDILKANNAEFNSFNILTDEHVRQGIKIFSDWPTIPQLYVGGEFIGGCDIMIEMHQNGELADLIKS